MRARSRSPNYMLRTLSAALPPIHAQHQIEHTWLPMCKWISVDHTFAVEVSELKWSLLCQNWERRKKDLFSCKSYEPRNRRVPSLWSRTFFHRSLNYLFFFLVVKFRDPCLLWLQAKLFQVFHFHIRSFDYCVEIRNFISIKVIYR